MDKSIFQLIAEYPFIHDGVFYHSSVLSQNRNCEKCKEKDCFEKAKSCDTNIDFICSKGYNCVCLKFNKQNYILNGLIFTDNKIIPYGRKEARKDWTFKRETINAFVDKTNNIEKYLIERETEIMEKKNSMFHDFKTSLNLFYNCTQNIINNLPGNSFEDKLKNSDIVFQDLYDSLELASSQLRMIDVIINPKSIKFGNKNRRDLFKLFDKMHKLFNYKANRKNVTISNNIGEKYVIADCLCYDSIELIPIILLDNAVKYSVPNSIIEIKMEQVNQGIKILIKSFGPLVSDENKDKIFEKYFRDESAQNFSQEGMGMGLWIAQQVLQLHDSTLLYHKDKNAKKDIGLNIFEFNLPLSI